jgi:predicted RNase H-like HicB family nuclease
MAKAKPRKKPTRRTAKGREYSVVIERDAAGWYVGSVPELPGCHTQAKSLDQLIERMREAIGLYADERQNGSEFIGVQRIAV